MSDTPSEGHTSDEEEPAYTLKRAKCVTLTNKLHLPSLVHALADVDVDERDLEYTVLNYLFIHMHPESAKTFIEESGIGEGPQLIEILSQRIIAREALLAGRIPDVINIVNEISPLIFKEHVEILFNLLTQELVDHIRRGDLLVAVQYARNVLSPLMLQKAELMQDLEEIMCLFSFPDLNCLEAAEILSKLKGPEEMAELLDIAILSHFNIGAGTVAEKVASEARWIAKKLETTLGWKGLELKNVERLDFRHDDNDE